MFGKKDKWSFEGHIAVPQIPSTRANALLQDLQGIGITNYDYFLSLVNLPYNGQPCRIDPGTHDVDNPMIITTSRFSNYQDAVKTILKGMVILQNYGINNGNFELEAVVNSRQALAFGPSINDFPGFTQQEESPKFENHILWEGGREYLPSINEIVRYHQDLFGYSPSQIADFCLVPNPLSHDTIWRVSTVYQPTREATLNFAYTIDINKGKFPLIKGIIAEQICVVSEPVRG